MAVLKAVVTATLRLELTDEVVVDLYLEGQDDVYLRGLGVLVPRDPSEAEIVTFVGRAVAVHEATVGAPVIAPVEPVKLAVPTLFADAFVLSDGSLRGK